MSLPPGSIGSDRSVLSELKDPIGQPEITSLGDLYRRFRIYRGWSFGRGAPLRFSQDADRPDDILDEDWNNLGVMLSNIFTQPGGQRKFVERLNDLYPGITNVIVRPQGGRLQLFFEEDRHLISASRLSDGTLRFVALLAILCQPGPPPLTCIEEPELGLHPDALIAISKLLKDASERTQLIVTTHSEILVDALTYSPEDVVVFEKGERGTVMKRLDGGDLKAWLEEYSLGQLWTSGQIGGNRW